MPSTTFANKTAIVDSDTILVERDGVSYKVTAENLANFALDDDLLLVSRSGVSYKCAFGDIDNARNTDLVLVDRGSSSYHITLADVRGILIPTVEFELRLTSPSFIMVRRDITPGGCDNYNWVSKRAKGGIVTMTINAPGTSTYSFDKIPGGQSASGGTQYPQIFAINGEWIAVVGNASAFSVFSQGSCQTPWIGKDALGFSDPGNKTIGPDGPYIADTVGQYSWTAPGVGGGCPAGAIRATPTSRDASDPGYSQYRTRGENVSGNVWNGVRIENPQWQPNDADAEVKIAPYRGDSGQDYSITYNGITKQYLVNYIDNITDLPLSGTIAEFEEWT